MPYIKPEDREQFTHEIDFIFTNTAGELNFVLTRIIVNHIESKEEGLSYAAINEVIGVLECAKLELYRRVAVPYENAKLSEHGDVYD